MTRKGYNVKQEDSNHTATKQQQKQQQNTHSPNDSQQIQPDNGHQVNTRGDPSTRKPVQNGNGHSDFDKQNGDAHHVSNGQMNTPKKTQGGGDPYVIAVPSSVTGDDADDDGEDDAKAVTGCCGRKRREKQATVGAFELFRYSGPLEILMMVIGTVAAMAAGCATPVNTIVLGSVVDIFIDNMQVANSTNQTYGDLILEEIKPVTLYFVYIGVGSLVSSYLAVSLWTLAGERQITRIRKLFFRGVMRQDIGWFDTHEVGELNSRFSDDMHKISEGMCDKMPVFIQWVTTFFTAYIVAFVKGWKLALACFAFSPLFILASSCVTRLIRSMAVKEFQAYAKAGAVAEQTLRAIRTVQAFQGQEKEEKRYEDNLVSATKVASKKGLVFGLGTSFFWVIIFCAFAVAFYYGVVLIQTEGFSPGNILVVFFGVLLGSMSLGHAFPNIEAFSNARAAAVKVFEVIGLHSVIDISSTSGKKLKELKGVVELKNIHFRYPARPEVKVLNGLSLTVNPGQHVALVGASGCGKSTAIQLLQRFYDPEQGQVTVDGHDVRDLNLKWLRDQIGVVSQEPVLFAATIAENIRYGRDGVTQSEIETAAKEANAHDFVVQLPQGYDTLIGERGAQLSGGQKQRIAIARALVRNPRILLLDEATSALDHESEAVVQAALEKAEVGRTTIVIAHRLSTIRYADSIVSLSHGQKEEEGTHDELIARDGLYAQLVKLQTNAESETGEDIGFLQIVEDDDDDEIADDDHLLKKVFLRSLSAGSGRSRSLSIRSSTRGKKGKDKDKDKGDNKKEDKDSTKEETPVQEASVKRLLRLNSPEWLQILVGTVFSAFCGLSHPSFAFIMSEFIGVFSITDKDEQTEKAIMLALIMVAIGIAVSIMRLTLSVCFAKSGSALTARLRSMAFKAVLKQDMSFFDSAENQVGTLTTRLANDAALVQGATGSKIGSLLEAVSTMAASLTIAFVYGWKLTLVILAFLPIMILAGKVQGRVIAGSAQSEKSQLQEAGKICSEAVDNIRTVASINREDIFINKLEKLLDEYKIVGLKTSLLFGITYALATSIQYFAFSAAFTYGTRLVADGEMEFFHVFRVFTSIIMGGSAVGRQSSFGVDFTKAKLAAGRLLALIDQTPKIDVNQPGGEKLANYTGQVGVRSVVFHYPTRPTVPVLNELTVAVEPGQTLALVGGSGCGKSTVLQLLQRFYDPDAGAMTIDGRDLRQMDLRWFRQQLGIVSQEPTLFDGSIASNIAYGDNTREVPMADIIAAARAANIHSFIDSLPQGYDTSVGDKGTQLSGGQKQRIAIARALIRRPKVLLLDEATSALDTESERVVQEALDKAREGRTCIVIAHRLTTIQNADRIAVINHGRVQEIGTHSQLVTRQGAYYRLLQTQNHSRLD